MTCPEHAPRRALVAAAVLLALGLSGCGEGAPPPAPAPTPSSVATDSASEAASGPVCDRLDLDELAQRSGLEFTEPGATGEPGGTETCVFASSDGGMVVYVDVADKKIPLEEALPGALATGVELEEITISETPALTGSTTSNGNPVVGIASHVGERTASITVTDANRAPREEALRETAQAVAEMVAAAG